MKLTIQFMASVLALASPSLAHAQGTFQNLDFENGAFIPIPGDPYGRVQFSAAMPGWTGYVGTNQINWILYNNLFLGTAGIAILDSTYSPPPHGQFYVQLQNGLDPYGSGMTISSAIAQTGTLPSTVQSVRFLTFNPFAAPFLVTFDGTPLALYHLGGDPGGGQIWGGDIASFAGRTGELRFLGPGQLDFIQLSDQPIPEPSSVGLIGLAALLLGWRLVRKGRDSA
jgi:hypothetical protein